MTNQVDGVREVAPKEAEFLSARGVVADLRRDDVIVHVGKPVGSITGWVGPIFWQVWLDARVETNTAYARIDQGEIETWHFDAWLSKEEILDRAKDRLLAQVEETRRARLEKAQRELAALAAS